VDDRLTKLRALEGVVLASIEGAAEDKRAPLVAQYRALLAEIESLSKSAEKAGDPVDEIAARRSARGGSTARSRRAGSGAG
jgi:hypothetical protein